MKLAPKSRKSATTEDPYDRRRKRSDANLSPRPGNSAKSKREVVYWSTATLRQLVSACGRAQRGGLHSSTVRHLEPNLDPGCEDFGYRIKEPAWERPGGRPRPAARMSSVVRDSNARIATVNRSRTAASFSRLPAAFGGYWGTMKQLGTRPSDRLWRVRAMSNGGRLTCRG